MFIFVYILLLLFSFYRGYGSDDDSLESNQDEEELEGMMEDEENNLDGSQQVDNKNSEDLDEEDLELKYLRKQAELKAKIKEQ